MTETPATAPVFPAGRYGRRRAPRTARRWVLPVLITLVVAAGVLVGARMYAQHGDPAYDAELIRYTGITDTAVVVDFRVRVPAGGSARCALRARTYDGAEVGRVEVVVTAAPGDETITARHSVPARTRPFIGEVVRCGPAA